MPAAEAKASRHAATPQLRKRHAKHYYSMKS